MLNYGYNHSTHPNQSRNNQVDGKKLTCLFFSIDLIVLRLNWVYTVIVNIVKHALRKFDGCTGHIVFLMNFQSKFSIDTVLRIY